MNGKQKGFTLIEILVVVTIIGVLAGLVVVLIPQANEKKDITTCTNNQRQFVGLLVGASSGDSDTWRRSGPNLLLQYVRKGDIEESSFKILFCPGDLIENLEKAGGAAAYKNLDMKSRDYGALTSYAGRNQDNSKCTVKPGQSRSMLTCDDSEDHHNKKGFVCGYTDGSVEWRDKDSKWEMDLETVVEVGEGSAVKELECLVSE